MEEPVENGDKIRILHLEDEELNLTLVSRILEGQIPDFKGRIELVQVKSVEDAKAEIEKGDFDYYFSDHTVEDGVGTEAAEFYAERIKSGKSTMPKGIMYLSAEVSESKNGDPQDNELALNKKVRAIFAEADADGNLVFQPKPFELKRFKENIGAMIEFARTAEEAREAETSPETFVEKISARRDETGQSKILIIESNYLVRKSLAAHFKMRGFEVLDAATSGEGFDILDENYGQVDGVVIDNSAYNGLDDSLPENYDVPTEIDGITIKHDTSPANRSFVSIMREDPGHNHIPAYVYTDPSEILDVKETAKRDDREHPESPPTQVMVKGEKTPAEVANTVNGDVVRDASDTLHK